MISDAHTLAEELLELKLFLEMPGRESYVRGLAE